MELDSLGKSVLYRVNLENKKIPPVGLNRRVFKLVIISYSTVFF